jgi:hypothetical protein
LAEEKRTPKKKSKEPRSIWRLLFWEALAAAGFYWLTRHALPPDWKGMPFKQNALFFLAAYPALFLYRWGGLDGFLGVLLAPAATVTGWILGASVYLWAEYAFLLGSLPYAGILRAHWIGGGLLFIPVYLLFLRNLMGISRLYYTMEECLALCLWAALGGGGGFWAGRLLDDHLQKTPFFENHRFMIWLLILWLGLVLALLIARKKK